MDAKNTRASNKEGSPNARPAGFAVGEPHGKDDAREQDKRLSAERDAGRDASGAKPAWYRHTAVKLSLAFVAVALASSLVFFFSPAALSFVAGLGIHTSLFGLNINLSLGFLTGLQAIPAALAAGSIVTGALSAISGVLYGVGAGIKALANAISDPTARPAVPGKGTSDSVVSGTAPEFTAGGSFEQMHAKGMAPQPAAGDGSSAALVGKGELPVAQPADRPWASLTRVDPTGQFVMEPGSPLSPSNLGALFKDGRGNSFHGDGAPPLPENSGSESGSDSDDEEAAAPAAPAVVAV